MSQQVAPTTTQLSLLEQVSQQGQSNPAIQQQVNSMDFTPPELAPMLTVEEAQRRAANLQTQGQTIPVPPPAPGQQSEQQPASQANVDAVVAYFASQGVQIQPQQVEQYIAQVKQGQVPQQQQQPNPDVLLQEMSTKWGVDSATAQQRARAVYNYYGDAYFQANPQHDSADGAVTLWSQMTGGNTRQAAPAAPALDKPSTVASATPGQQQYQFRESDIFKMTEAERAGKNDEILLAYANGRVFLDQ